MNSVLLLGAGLTRAAAGRQAKAMLPPLDADFFGIAGRAYKADTDQLCDYLRQLVGGYSELLTDSLEAAATHLYLKAREAERRDPAHSGFMQLLALLNRVLAETTNPIKTAAPSLVYRFLRKELDLAGASEDLTIITFNYDLLIERVLAELARAERVDIFAFPGCYRLPEKELGGIRGIAKERAFENADAAHMGVTVLKLHGSLNWHSTHGSRDTMPREMFGPNRKIMLTNSPMIRNSLTLKRGGKTVYLQPVVIPPVSGKTHLMHEDVRTLWMRAATALRSADRLVIAGYSCPPLDIESRILISESLRDGRLQTVHVINPDMKLADTFSRLCSVDNAIVYKDLTAWMEQGYR